MVKITIADDYPLVREGIRKVLNNHIDINLIGEAADSKDLFKELDKEIPDLLILDLTMPGRSGLGLLKEIKSQYPCLDVLILSMHPPERFAVRAIKAGASGYLCKSSVSKELVSAIRRIVHHKRKYITDDVAEQLALQVDTDGELPLHKILSDRELEVMCMIAEGTDIKHIAYKLSLSPNTIHTYRSRIKEKMNLNSNVEITRYVLENDLIS